MFNAQTFDRKAFEVSFSKSLGILIESEKITKAELRELSRTVLEALHITEDVAFINRLIDALTPVNRRASVEYFKHFGGFHYAPDEGKFTKKNKAIYSERRALAERFLEDVHNNIWSWAERELKVEAKAFDLSAVTKFTENALKKAAEIGKGQVDVLRAVLAAGIDVESLISIMDELGYAEVKTEGEEAQVE